MPQYVEKSLFKGLVSTVEAWQTDAVHIDEMRRMIAGQELTSQAIIIKIHKNKWNYRVIYCGIDITRQYRIDFTSYEFEDIRRQFKISHLWSSLRHCLKAYAEAGKSGSPHLSRNELKLDDAGVVRFSRLILPIVQEGKVPYLIAAFAFDP